MKQLKNVWSFVLCLLLVCSVFVPVSAADETQVLNVYNWGVYMDLGGDDDLGVTKSGDDEDEDN